MKFNIIALDGRYNGNGCFKYRIEFSSSAYGYDGRKHRAHQHQEMLEWLWENYGPGCDRDHWKLITFKDHTPVAEARKNGPRWAWFIDTKFNTPYIYIADDTVLSHVQLKWTT